MQDFPFDRDALMAILDFHVEAGIDLALDEVPHDRFAETPTAAVSRPAETPGPEIERAPPIRPRPLANLAALSPEDAAEAARELARDATTLEALEDSLGRFEGCALKFAAKTMAFSDGNPRSRVMLVGDAPGADEDRVGKPFQGRAGELLDRMLAAIGLDRNQVYMANVVPWRPPGNRPPTPQEIAICKPFIARQIELAAPDFLICLGGTAAQNLLGVKDGILRARGQWRAYRTQSGHEIRALATLHPTYLVGQPLQKRLVWRDFQSLRHCLDGRA